MSKFDDTNRGSIWPNKKKRDGKKDPDFTGSLNVDGQEYFFDAWKKSPDAKENAPSLSFRVKRKDGKPKDSKPPASASRRQREDMDDEIPF